MTRLGPFSPLFWSGECIPCGSFDGFARSLRRVIHMRSLMYIDQFRETKIQSNTADLSMRLWGINPTNSVVITQSLVLRSIVWDWILIYRNLSIPRTFLAPLWIAHAFRRRLRVFPDRVSLQYNIRISVVPCVPSYLYTRSPPVLSLYISEALIRKLAQYFVGSSSNSSKY